MNYDFIRGLVAGGSGTFTLTTTSYGYGRKKIPSFQIRVPAGNKQLLEEIREALQLTNSIYTYQYSGKDGYRRNPFAMLIVRDFGSLKNKIIPLFCNGLIGKRNEQFTKWLESIGSDPVVPENYRLLYRLYKDGYFKKELRKGGLFEKFLV